MIRNMRRLYRSSRAQRRRATLATTRLVAAVAPRWLPISAHNAVLPPRQQPIRFALQSVLDRAINVMRPIGRRAEGAGDGETERTRNEVGPNGVQRLSLGRHERRPRPTEPGRRLEDLEAPEGRSG